MTDGQQLQAVDEVGEARRRREAAQRTLLNGEKAVMQLGESTRRRFHELFSMVQGARSVANMSVEVANNLVKQYESAIGAYLDENGIDPDTVNVSANFKTGELTVTLKPAADVAPS